MGATRPVQGRVAARGGAVRPFVWDLSCAGRPGVRAQAQAQASVSADAGGPARRGRVWPNRPAASPASFGRPRTGTTSRVSFSFCMGAAAGPGLASSRQQSRLGPRPATHTRLFSPGLCSFLLLSLSLSLSLSISLLYTRHIALLSFILRVSICLGCGGLRARLRLIAAPRLHDSRFRQCIGLCAHSKTCKQSALSPTSAHSLRGLRTTGSWTQTPPSAICPPQPHPTVFATLSFCHLHKSAPLFSFLSLSCF